MLTLFEVVAGDPARELFLQFTSAGLEFLFLASALRLRVTQLLLELVDERLLLLELVLLELDGLLALL